MTYEFKRSMKKARKAVIKPFYYVALGSALTFTVMTIGDVVRKINNTNENVQHKNTLDYKLIRDSIGLLCSSTVAAGIAKRRGGRVFI